MSDSPITLFSATSLKTEQQVAETLVQVRKYLDDRKLPHPPMPLNVVSLAPCDLLITETKSETGSRTGHVKITHANGVLAYEQIRFRASDPTA